METLFTTNSSSTVTLKDGRKLGYIKYGDPHGKPLFYNIN